MGIPKAACVGPAEAGALPGRPGVRCCVSGTKAVATRLESPMVIVRSEVWSSDGRPQKVGDDSSIKIIITVSNRNDSG